MKKIVLEIVAVLLFVAAFDVHLYAQGIKSRGVKTYTKRILVIEQNPYLTTLKMDVCEYTRQSWSSTNPQLVVSESVKDIEYGSHGLVKCEIVKWEKFNEFPKYKNEITLKSGKKAYSFDEETYLELLKDGWYNLWSSPYFTQLTPYSYDYEYLFEKLDLINRRNNNEFNEVWLVAVDPSCTYESIMVGQTAYWINGTPLIKDCNNFRFMGMSTSRRDTGLEGYGHAAEQILGNTFKTSYRGYKANTLPKDTAKMNLWERFLLNENAAPGRAAVGNVHFAPNSTRDYDWSNDSYVTSSWIDWLYYPNLTGRKKRSNCSDWLSETLEGDNSVARKHHRWWFWLMPHVAGRTADGFSNSWWDYLCTLDYVRYINAVDAGDLQDLGADGCVPCLQSKKNRYYQQDTYIQNLEFRVHYQSGKEELVKIDRIPEDELNVISSDTSVVKIRNGKLYAAKTGTSRVTLYLDGVSDFYNVTVYSLTANEDVEDNKIWVLGRTIHVKAKRSSKIQIYNSVGMLVYQKQSTGNDEFLLPAHGFYVVIGDGFSQKVLVK